MYNTPINRTSLINKQLPYKHTYSQYYPSILDPNFGNKISSHTLFKNYKLNQNPNKLKELYDKQKNMIIVWQNAVLYYQCNILMYILAIIYIQFESESLSQEKHKEWFMIF